ncbi:MAG: nitroreductase family protein [Anaerolineales bacterium]|nr:nitroreductase family protein [Anaerolineales bacterium]
MDSKLKIIFSRRSIRQYTGEPLSNQEIQSLLEAGMAAPSASDKKPWHFVMATTKEQREALANAHPYGKMIANAGLAIAVCGDMTIAPDYWVQDCSAATENILVAAAGLGLGAVWLGCHPKTERVNAVRSVLNIPDHIGILSLISVGRPAEEKPARTQFDPSFVHKEIW